MHKHCQGGQEGGIPCPPRVVSLGSNWDEGNGGDYGSTRSQSADCTCTNKDERRGRHSRTCIDSSVHIISVWGKIRAAEASQKLMPSVAGSVICSVPIYKILYASFLQSHQVDDREPRSGTSISMV